MLHCIYHPIEKMRIVDNDEREKMLASGVWFDSPKDAEEMRKQNERIILNEPKHRKQKVKPEDRSHEKGRYEQQCICEERTKQNEKTTHHIILRLCSDIGAEPAFP
jgi:hypothetical protein